MERIVELLNNAGAEMDRWYHIIEKTPFKFGWELGTLNEMLLLINYLITSSCRFVFSENMRFIEALRSVGVTL